MAGWGTSPSPAISLEVSTMTTRFLASWDKTLAISRSMVVLPTPGRPKSRMFLPEKARSSIILMVPKTARPTRQVMPMTCPFRLRMADIRCRVRSMPARLSSPNSPIRSITFCRSPAVTGHSFNSTSSETNRASGWRPKSSTISSNWSRSSRARRTSATLPGSTFRTSSISSCSLSRPASRSSFCTAANITPPRRKVRDLLLVPSPS